MYKIVAEFYSNYPLMSSLCARCFVFGGRFLLWAAMCIWCVQPFQYQMLKEKTSAKYLTRQDKITKTTYIYILNADIGLVSRFRCLSFDNCRCFTTKFASNSYHIFENIIKNWRNLGYKEWSNNKFICFSYKHRKRNSNIKEIIHHIVIDSLTIITGML